MMINAATGDPENVPTLRFPEFKGEWNKGVISDFLTKVADPVSVERGRIYREIGVRSHGRGVFHKEAVSGELLGDKRVFWVRPNAFVLNIVFAWEQAVALTTEAERGFIASHRFPMFVPAAQKADLGFVQRFFLRKQGKHLLKLASPGGAGRNKTLGQNEFSKLAVIFPPVPEQKKIAAFLGAVDEKLDALRRKRELLADYKRGVMQQIFTQKIRFMRDNGSSFPEWQAKRLKEVFHWVNTNSLSREMLTFEGGTVQNIHYGDIHSKFKALFRQSSERVPYILPSATPRSISDEQFCKIGDLVIADASEDYADIGKAVEIVEVQPNSLVAGLHTYIARPFEGSVVVGFSGYLFRTATMRRQIMRIAQGISVLGISKGNLSTLSVLLPHPDEQKKIADFLSALDAKIDAVAGQIAQMEAFKAGLLQQMFV